MLEINHRDASGQQLMMPHYNLYLLAELAVQEVPSLSDAGVCAMEPGSHSAALFEDRRYHTFWLKPGVHRVEGDLLHLHSHSRLHLQGGAYLRSYVHADWVEHLTIDGHGVIDGTDLTCRSREWRDDGDAAFVLIRHGHHIHWQGPTIFNAPFWNLVLHGGKNIVVRHYKGIGWRMNNDGIQPRNCENLTVEKCFLKCADDCVAIKSRRTAAMSFGRLQFRDLVLWNDHPGNVVEIGHTSQADHLSMVQFENIEVVHAESPKNDRFIISIFLVDHCRVEEITYDGFYVEGFVNMRDIGFQIASSRYSTDPQRGKIGPVQVINYYRDSDITAVVLHGYDSEHNLHDVSLGPMYQLESGQTVTDPVRAIMPVIDALHAVNIHVSGSE